MNLKHVLLILVLVSFVLGCISQETEESLGQSSPISDKSIIIALYSDRGADEGCVQATKNMFE